MCSRRTWASNFPALALRAQATRCVQFGSWGVASASSGANEPREGRKRVSGREPGVGAGAGDPFLLILSPGIPGFGTGRLSLAGGGARAGCMSWATGQENMMFPSALAAALSGWPAPKPLPLQPPCPTFPGCLAPPSSSALTSPLSPAPSPPLTAAGPGYCGDCEAGRPGEGPESRWGPPGCWTPLPMQNVDMEVGEGEPVGPVPAEIAARSQGRTGEEEKPCFQRRGV